VNTHWDEGALQALIDGELPPGDAAAAEAHLAACAACAAELRALRNAHERTGAMLAGIDVSAPVAQATMSLRARRLRAGRYAEARRTLARAAVLVLALAGVALAVPGTGVHEWAVRTVVPAAKAPAPQAMTRAAQPAAIAPEASPTGVSIRADGGAVKVVLIGVPAQVQVRARLVDGDVAGVLARGPAAATARFRTSTGKIEVREAAAGTLEVQIPRGAGAATVEVNGRVYVAKDGDALRVLPAAASGQGPAFRVGG
jgi:anti-sigma factor RsiW